MGTSLQYRTTMAPYTETVWQNKAECDDAESAYFAKLAGAKSGGGHTVWEDKALAAKFSSLEIENKELRKVTEELKNLVISLSARVAKLENSGGGVTAIPPAATDENDDDVDLFGSDDEEEDAEKARITAERLKAYHEKKSKKPQVIAKTSVLFDVKPWDDETPHDKMLESCKSIEMDGLVWGASKLVPIGYGIKKLQIMCTVEDAKVSIDELSEKIEEFEDYVQSVDVAAMNKI